MATTAKIHFDQDMARAAALLKEANRKKKENDSDQLLLDIRGSAVALAVGALDAYLCDKYVDCLTKALTAYSKSCWPGTFPAFFRKQNLPAGEVLDARRTARPKWGIRMAARKLMERDNMYSLARLDDTFNGILPAGHKLWEGIVNPLVALGKKRFTKYNTAELNKLAGDTRKKAIKAVMATVKNRINQTVQFRHDWIHNCSRPKSAIFNFTHGEAAAAIDEIKQFIEIFDNHIEAHRIV
jgi:hypothetical protein